MSKMIRKLHPTTKVVEKSWGREEWIVNNEMYCGKFLYLNKFHQSSMHYHKIKHETFYLDEGIIIFEIDGLSPRVMTPGNVQEILPNKKHRYTGIKKSRIIEFSTHHEDEDSYRIEGMLGGKVEDIRGFVRSLGLEEEVKPYLVDLKRRK